MKSISSVLLWGILIVSLLSCSKQKTTDKTPSTKPTLVEVSAIYDAENDRHLFQTDTDTIPKGWTTFRFNNRSPMIHFLFFNHLPEGKTSDDLINEARPVFQWDSYPIMEGKTEEGMAKFAELPEWFNDVVFRGGAGFVSPGKTTETTLFMEPGNYEMECYIRTADGTFHWSKGETRALHVTGDSTMAKPPQSPTIEVTTTDDGLEVDGDPNPGKHLVAVHFKEENPEFVAKDVHVALLNGNTKLEDIATWLDFNNSQGLVSTADNPGPATFIGGTHEMPYGNTAYFTIDLDPGRYVWISEHPASKKTIQEFTVNSTSK